MEMYTEGAYVEILARLIHDYVAAHPEHGLRVENVEMDMQHYTIGRIVGVAGRHNDTECRGRVEVEVPYGNEVFPDVPLLIKQLEEDIARNLLGISE